MPGTRVFRVFIGKKNTFYVDTEATSAAEATDKVRDFLLYPNGDLRFVADNIAYEGCEVGGTIEIKREDAHLDV